MNANPHHLPHPDTAMKMTVPFGAHQQIPVSVKLPLSWGKVESYVLTKIARFAKNIPNDAAFRLDALLV